MIFFSKLLFIVIALYTFGFSITLWKEKNKSGSLAVCALAASIAILPFFTT